MIYRHLFQAFCLLCAGLVLAACEKNQSQTNRQSAHEPYDSITSAIAAPTRPSDDKKDDAARKPDIVLSFVDVRPGAQLFELEAGSGYYTELFSLLVGDNGRVIMHNPPSFDNFLGDDIKARTAGGRLHNVIHSRTNFDELEIGDEQVDLVTWFLGPHDLFFAPAGVNNLGDPQKAFLEIARILKPGGEFVVLDHAAKPGTTTTASGAVHRIDPAVVKRLAADAGLSFVAESDAFRNPNDNYEMSVFDPAVRRKTDQFLLKYRKPLAASTATSAQAGGGA